MKPSPVIRRAVRQDAGGIAALLSSRGLAEDDDLAGRIEQLCTASRGMCACAVDRDGISGAAIAVFTGFHVFLSHIAVAHGRERRGIGSALLGWLEAEARTRGARGIIADAKLKSAGYFFDNGFRLPGVVFMIHDLGRSSTEPPPG